MTENIALKKIEKPEEYTILRRLWQEYIAALSKYKTFEENPEIIAEEEAAPHWCRDDYIIFQKNTPVGFVITGQYPNAFSKGDIYIQEFFVREEFQRKGIGKQAIEKRLSRTGKDVSMYIIQNNEPAKFFWSNTMAKLGYEDRFRVADITATTEDGLDFRYYTATS